MPIIGSEAMSRQDEFVSNRETVYVTCHTCKLLKNLYYWSDTSGGFFSGDVSLDVSHVKSFHPVVVVFTLSGEDCGIAGNLYIDFSSE